MSYKKYRGTSDLKEYRVFIRDWGSESLLATMQTSPVFKVTQFSLTVELYSNESTWSKCIVNGFFSHKTSNGFSKYLSTFIWYKSLSNLHYVLHSYRTSLVFLIFLLLSMSVCLVYSISLIFSTFIHWSY